MFDSSGEAKVMSALAEARIDPRQTPNEKQAEENALVRELQSLSPQELSQTVAQFEKMNTGNWNWTEIHATQRNQPDASVLEFHAMGYRVGRSEDFKVEIKK